MKCQQCGGSGRRATARSASGRELERHERSGTRCDACDGAGEEHPSDVLVRRVAELRDGDDPDALERLRNGI